VNGVVVRSGKSEHVFGFTVLRYARHRWNLALKTSHGATLVTCRILDDRPATCRNSE
jgi:hypothetical protein